MPIPKELKLKTPLKQSELSVHTLNWLPKIKKHKKIRLNKLNLNSTLVIETPNESKSDKCAQDLFKKTASLKSFWIAHVEKVKKKKMLVLMKKNS